MSWRILSLLLVSAWLTAQTADTTIYPLSTTAEALTVKATRIPHGELATERLTQMEVYLNSAAKADPLLAVNTLPAATNPEETANVSLRGSPSVATGTYLNGVPLRSAVRLDQSNGVGQFSIFGQLPLREIRVYPSSPPVTFSQSSAGAVAIETATARPTTTQRSLSVNLVGVGYAHTAPVGEGGGISGYVNASDLTAFRAMNGRKLADLRESRTADAMLSYVHSGKADRRLRVFYLGFAERYTYDIRGMTGGQQEFRQRKPRHLGVVNYDWKKGEWQWRLNQLIDWEKPRYTVGDFAITVEQLNTHTALHGERRMDDFTLQAGGATTHYFDPGGHRQVTEAYLSSQYRSGRWLLGAGAKPVFDGEWAINAQLAARFAVGDHRFHLTGSRHTQLLSPDAAFFDWQRLHLLQSALEYHYTIGRWEAQTAAYLKRERYETTGTVFVRGAEASLTYRHGGWLATAAVTSVRSRGDSAITRRDIPFAFRGRLQYSGGNWTFGLAHRARQGTPSSITLREPVERLPDYGRLDASLTRTMPLRGGALIVYLNVNNLADRRNVSGYSFRGEEYYSRRLFFFGAVYNW